MRSLVTTLCVLGLGVSALAAEPVTMTFIAGSGYVVGQGEFKVAIDGLTSLETPAETQALMAAAQPPFDVDLILVTHSDLDHFDASLTARNMAANAEAVLVGPADVIEAVRALAPTLAAGRFSVAHPWPYARQVMSAAGLSLDAYSFPHFLGRPENVGYRFRVGGFLFVDPGDLDLDTAADDLARTGIGRTTADVLIVPYYAFHPGYASILSSWPARLYVPTHTALSELQVACTWARAVTESVLCFTAAFETKTIALAPPP